MKLYPEFNISLDEAEATLAVIHLTEFVDRENTASSLIRDLEERLKDVFGNIEQKIHPTDPHLGSEGGPEKLLKQFLPRIQTRTIRFLLYPVAEKIVGVDKKINKDETKYLKILKQLLAESKQF